jgi:Tfp pilus assembly protein PilN
MFELNLIKEKIKFIEGRDRFYEIFRFVYGILFILCLFNALRFSFISYKIAVSNGERADLSKKIALSKQMIGVDRLEKDWTGYFDEVRKIEQVVGSRSNWAGRLYALSTILPEGICVDSIDIQNRQDGQRLILDLIVRSAQKDKQEFEIINQFMSSLENNKYFAKEVKLESQEKRILNNESVEFYRISVALSA